MNERRTIPRWAELPRLVRYFVIGGINTVFGYGAYAAFVYVGFHYAAAAFLATVVGVLFNFFTTGRFVFRQVMHARLMVRFVAVYAVVYVVNVAALTALQHVAIGSYRLDPYVAGIVLVLPIALLSYALMRRFVFARDHVAH